MIAMPDETFKRLSQYLLSCPMGQVRNIVEEVEKVVQVVEVKTEDENIKQEKDNVATENQ